MTLLEKCEQNPKTGKKPISLSQEEVEVIFAWLDGKLSNAQVQKALGFKLPMQLYVYMSVRLKIAWKTGHLKRTIPK